MYITFEHRVTPAVTQGLGVFGIIAFNRLVPQVTDNENIFLPVFLLGDIQQKCSKKYDTLRQRKGEIIMIIII